MKDGRTRHEKNVNGRERYGGHTWYSLVISAGVDVDNVGVAHHHDVAVAAAGVKQSGSDILFREIAWVCRSEGMDSAKF